MWKKKLTQWSIHKPGTCLSSVRLTGFPPPPPLQRTVSESTRNSIHSRKLSNASSNNVAALPPRPTPNPSTSSLSRLSVSSGRSNRFPMIAVDDSVTQFLLSASPRSQMVAFTNDTEFCLCVSSSLSSSNRRPSTSSSSNAAADLTTISRITQGTIYRTSDGQPSIEFGPQPAHQKLTAVDWTHSSNACLLGSIDGSVKVTNLIRM